MLRYIGLALLATAWHRVPLRTLISRNDLHSRSTMHEMWGGKVRVIVPLPQADSVRKNKPSILLIKAFSEDITKPLTSAIAVIRSRVTGKTERLAMLNGRLERTFTTPDEVFIEVSAPGYSSVKRSMKIVVTPQGNRHEVDAELARTTISLTIWAVDRKTDKIIPNARFTLSGKATGMASLTLTPDATTGLSTIELPSKGTYIISSTAEGYADFVKSIKLDSAQNEARVIFVAKPPSGEKKPPTKPVAVSAVSETKPAAKTAVTAPVATSTASASVVASKPFGLLDRGKPIRLQAIYFDQSSPVLRSESYPELDLLVTVLMENPSLQIEIRGHTDNQGDFDLNIKLSRDRSQAVIDYLAGKGIPKSRLRAVGRGPIDPIAPNNNEENRKKNRRVEFVVF